MTKITKKIIDEMDREFKDYSYQSLDVSYCVAYHPKALGMTIREWMIFIEEYCKERDRDFFFATNEYQKPTVYFDATNEEEWRKVQKLATDEQIKFWDSEGWSMKKVIGKENRFKKKH